MRLSPACVGSSTGGLYSSTKWPGAEEKHTVATCTQTGCLFLPLPVLLVSSISSSVTAKSERQALLSHLTGEETGRKWIGSTQADHDASRLPGCWLSFLSQLLRRKTFPSKGPPYHRLYGREGAVGGAQANPDGSQVPRKAFLILLRHWQLPLAHAEDSGFSLQR